LLLSQSVTDRSFVAVADDGVRVQWNRVRAADQSEETRHYANGIHGIDRDHEKGTLFNSLPINLSSELRVSPTCSRQTLVVLERLESTINPGGYYGNCYCYGRLSCCVRGTGGSDSVYTIWQMMASKNVRLPFLFLRLSGLRHSFSVQM